MRTSESKCKTGLGYDRVESNIPLNLSEKFGEVCDKEVLQTGFGNTYSCISQSSQKLGWNIPLIPLNPQSKIITLEELGLSDEEFYKYFKTVE